MEPKTVHARIYIAIFRYNIYLRKKALFLATIQQVDDSLVPRCHPKNWERGLVTLANFLVCAESAYCNTTSLVKLVFLPFRQNTTPDFLDLCSLAAGRGAG